MTAATPAGPLLKVHDLTVVYPGRNQEVVANNHVSMHLGTAETLGVVGESGSGKTTLGGAVLGFAPVASGHVEFEGRDITHLPVKERRQLTRHIQVIHQKPQSSMNPSLDVSELLTEPLMKHRINLDSKGRRHRVELWMNLLELPPSTADKHPGDLTGDQRQRIAIARALMIEPKLVVCDEAVSALPSPIQTQVLDLMIELQRQVGVSYLFITNDLSAVEYIAQRVAVMRRGHIVETGPTSRVFKHPRQAYTRDLLDTLP
jgi:ABC-type oligopeptide transport system ATPase subunit